MSDAKQVQDLPALASVTGDELILIVDVSGVSRKTDVNSLLDKLENSPTGALLASNNLSDLTNAALARVNLGLGSLSIQNKDSVAITGGNIDGTELGVTVPAAATVTDFEATGTVTLPTDSIQPYMIADGILNSQLANNSVTVSAGTGLTGGGTVELGQSITLDLDPTNITNIDGGLF